MGTTGATFVRFGFGVPVRAALRLRPQPLRRLSDPGGQCALSSSGRSSAASARSSRPSLLIHLFSFRNFAVGTAYSRTEPAQAALFGLLFLGETVTLGAHHGDRHQRVRRHADFGRPYRRRLALAAVVGGQPQCADRARVGHAVRRLGGRLPRRVAGARRPELHDAGGRDAGLSSSSSRR